MSRKQQRREALLWQRLTDLLISRHETTGRGRAPRAVRDLIDEGRDSGLPAEVFARRRTIDGDRILGQTWGTTARLSVLLDGQWPTGGYRFLAELATLATEVKAFIADDLRRPADRRAAERTAADRLVDIAEDASRDGARWDDLTPWLVVLAQTTNPSDADVLWSGLLNWDQVRRGKGFDPERDASAADWARAIGPGAGWAFAAGVPFSEVEAQAQARTLDVEALRTLAMLRGYRVFSLSALIGLR